MPSEHNEHASSRMVSLTDEQAVTQILGSTVMRLWEVVNDLTRIHPSRRERYRVAIFGSARAGTDTFAYDAVRRAAAAFAAMGCDIVTGGGPGLMEAANEGAASSRGNGRKKTRSFGLTIAVPYEKANPYLDSVTAHRTFFSRLHHFVRMSQAFVIFPGGIGTALELLMVWQLLQVGFMTERPVVLVGEMWQGLVDWMRREMVPRKLINAEDLDLVHLVGSIEEAATWIERHKEKFDQAREKLILERRRAARAIADRATAAAPAVPE